MAAGGEGLVEKAGVGGQTGRRGSHGVWGQPGARAAVTPGRARWARGCPGRREVWDRLTLCSTPATSTRHVYSGKILTFNVLQNS